MLIFITAYPAALLAADYEIPADRRITWQGNVGVDGDIPNRTAIYDTINASSGDRRATIQAALDACPANGVVVLGLGNFDVYGTLIMSSNITLRGAGIGSTTLTQTNSSSGATVSFGSGNYGTAVNLSSGYTKGSTIITTSSAHGWSSGDVILIDQILGGTSYDPPITNVGSDGTCGWCGRDSGTRPLGQLVQLATASGSSATLDIPLYWSFDSVLVPQGVKLNKSSVFAGIEDLKIVNSSTMNNNQNETGTINMTGTSNCWLYNVEIHGAKRMGVNLARCYRNTLRGVTVHKTLYYTSNNGYSIWLRHGVSACLIENCTFYDMSNGPIANGPISGNVLAYNYTTDMQSTTYPTAMRAGFNFHGGHPIMNLLEGNYFDGQYFAADTYWGSSSHNTLFRNRILTDPTKTAQPLDVAIDYRSQYYNIVGNVLGTIGKETVYIANAIPYPGDAPCISVFEWSGSDNTKETALIHQNYDYYHDATLVCDHADNPGCQGGSKDTSLPDSLYLTAKPPWWGALPWPAIGPDLNPMVNTIPAKVCYESDGEVTIMSTVQGVEIVPPITD